ncbi:hypothetical protein ABZ897_44970 [Nonomuraea sp. NPDC046802]|uniref:hypothetical protein n=1 Tax=Nonomuraea sp. NPDC046802 TaxID=3154919 RepID=UPI0033D36535
MTHANTTAARRTVQPGHARALANHGPGWAIMWDDRDDQPVIVRPERGDDGTLLEICGYEGMFTLGGDCDPCEDAHTCDACMPDGQPNFEVIADHMTNILSDVYADRTDIAACMPLTLPYTRALAEHGYQRRFQGNRQAHTFNQLYRSPDGHLVELQIPLPNAPADAPTIPLTIEWTYLRPRPTSPDTPTPETNLPADTPPTDIAALIAAHIAIHPPTPTTPGDTTDGTDRTDGTDAPDRAATPATA